MSVTKDASTGRYEVQAWYKDRLGNRKKAHKRGFRTKAEATAWERELLLKKAGSPHMTLGDFYELYKEDTWSRIRPSTRVTKDSMVRKWVLPFLGGMHLDEIEPKHVLSWQNELSGAVNPRTGEHYAPTFLRSVNAQLSALLNHAVRYYGLSNNPVHVTGRIGEAHAQEMQFWTKEEYLRFAEAVADKPLSHALFEVLYWGGLREGEALALLPGDIDFGAGAISVSKTFQVVEGKEVVGPPKTPRGKRSVAMPDFVMDELRDYLRYTATAGGRIFPVTKSYLYHEMRRGCEVSGVKVIRVHDLRHSHISLLIHLGFSALAIADRVGHESTYITERYAHLMPGVRRDVADALSNQKEVTQ